MKLVIVPGYGDRYDYIDLITKNWQKKYGFEVETFVFGWNGEAKSYDRKWQKFVDKLSAEDEIVILGISAGASVAYRAFIEYPDKVRGVIGLCGPWSSKFLKPEVLRKKYPVLQRSFSSFSSDKLDPKKIMTLRPMLDTIVYPRSVYLPKANNKRMISISHGVSIVVGLALYQKQIAKFVNSC